MRVVLLGPPGCGKGTQAKLLAARNGLEHISTGDLLRDALRRGTPLGLEAQRFLGQGRLVPDDLVNQIVRERFCREPPRCFVLDGYPRTVAQAGFLGTLLDELGQPLTRVVLLEVDDAEILQRILGRLTCPACKRTYHCRNNPPRQPGLCDVCGSGLEQRADDREETVRARLAVYHEQTVKLLPFYRQKGLLAEIPGTGDIEQIYRKLMAALQPQAGMSC